MRKTKIVCTIGPSSNSPEMLKALIKSGMNVARLNMSHATREENREVFKRIIKAREELNTPLAIMLDTKGPEIRIGAFSTGEAILKKGQKFVLNTKACEGTNEQVFVNYAGLIKDVKSGDKILIDDGLIELKVVKTSDTEIETKVVSGGKLTNRKSVFVPNVKLNMPFLTPADKEDLKMVADFNLEFVAASFVSKKEDAIELRKYLNKLGAVNTEIIAKIESVEGVKNVNEIADVVDGIMVARGDLGVEVSQEKLPAIQNNIISAALNKGKLLIMATEMLESMTFNIRPTRAEVADVANAVFLKCGAVMLSGETAVGIHPTRVVETMAKICVEAENSINFRREFNLTPYQFSGVTSAIAHSAVRCAFDLNSKAICAFTLSGKTAKLVSAFKPQASIVGLTTCPFTYNQLAFYFGVQPALVNKVTATDELFNIGKNYVIQNKLVKSGETIVVVAGAPAGKEGQTNILKVDKI